MRKSPIFPPKLDSEIGITSAGRGRFSKESNSDRRIVDSELHQESGLSQNLDSDPGHAGLENGLFPPKLDSFGD